MKKNKTSRIGVKDFLKNTFLNISFKKSRISFLDFVTTFLFAFKAKYFSWIYFSIINICIIWILLDGLNIQHFLFQCQNKSWKEIVCHNHHYPP